MPRLTPEERAKEIVDRAAGEEMSSLPHWLPVRSTIVQALREYGKEQRQTALAEAAKVAQNIFVTRQDNASAEIAEAIEALMKEGG